jgi:hypothetical protein
MVAASLDPYRGYVSALRAHLPDAVRVLNKDGKPGFRS